MTLAIISTHPVQYQAPVYRTLQSRFNIPVTVIYGSDFSVKGYQDKEFGASFSWDVDLLSGYTAIFLHKVAEGGAQSYETVSAAGLRKTLKKISPHAVLLSGYQSSFHRRAFCDVWALNYPILFRGETTDHAKQRNVLQAWLRDISLRFIYRRCRKLLYIGHYSHEHYKRLGCSEGKLVFSPYAVDGTVFECDEDARKRYRDRVRAELGISGNHSVILFSGKLTQRKRPDFLLRALEHMPLRIRENIEIVFLGEGRMREELEKLAKRLSFLQVHFLGFKNQTQLSPYYHAADLLVLPSRHSETWGLVVNEALHHGLPCVVSDQVGCAPDLIERGKTGDVFHSGSVAALASSLQNGMRLAGKPEIREICRQKVSSYSIEKAAEGIAEAYHSVSADN